MNTTQQNDPHDHETLDAHSLIYGDLARRHQQRRRHFVPAVVMLLGIFATMGVLVGVRSNLLEQPLWQIAAQSMLWLICLFVLPAVGLGLSFPARPARVAVVSAAVLLAVLSTLGWPLGPLEGDAQIGGCAVMIAGYAAAIFGLGAFSGAFSQRRSSSSAYWIAGSISLAALNAVNWHCPMGGGSHALFNHIGASLVVLGGVCASGFFIHRLSRSRLRQN